MAELHNYYELKFGGRKNESTQRKNVSVLAVSNSGWIPYSHAHQRRVTRIKIKAK